MLLDMTYEQYIKLTAKHNRLMAPARKEYKANCQTMSQNDAFAILKSRQQALSEELGLTVNGVHVEVL